MESANFDRALGVVFLALGIGAILHAHGLKVAFAADPIGPKPFPMLVGGILALTGAVLMVRPEPQHWQPGASGKVAAVALASLVYPVLLIPLGFVPATSLLCMVVALALKGTWIRSAIASVACAAVIFVLIDLLLGLPLPRGPLGI